MIDTLHKERVAGYARDILTQLDTLLEARRPAAWVERLQSWAAECRRAPLRAFREDMLTRAVDDLAILETASKAYALEPAKPAQLVEQDRGGAVCAIAALNGALTIVEQQDPVLAQRLARRARDLRAQHRADIRRLIVERA